MTIVNRILNAKAISRQDVVNLLNEHPDVMVDNLAMYSEVPSTSGLDELKNNLVKYTGSKELDKVKLIINKLDELHAMIANILNTRKLNLELIDGVLEDKLLITKSNGDSEFKSIASNPLSKVFTKRDILKDIFISRESLILLDNVPNIEQTEQLIAGLREANVISIYHIASMLKRDVFTVINNERLICLLEGKCNGKLEIDALTHFYNNAEYITSAVKAVLVALTDPKE